MQLERTLSTEETDAEPRLSDEDQELIDTYHRDYPGVMRGQLATQNQKLYLAMYRRILLDCVPVRPRSPVKAKAPIKSRRIINDPVMYYHMLYANVTKAALSKKDPFLYEQLKKMGKSDIVPNKYQNPLDDYLDNFAHLDQTQLRKEQPSLYQRLWRKGLLKNVPKKDFYEE